MNQGHRYSCVVEGLIIGASMGAMAGYLFAPRAQKLLKKTASAYSNVHDKIDRVLERAAGNAETKLNKMKEVFGRA